MRVVFFGTPAFAVPSLDALLGAGIEVVAVVTQPDRAQGRSRSTLVPPPVKVRALEAGLSLFQPERPRGDVFHQTMRALEPDLGIVVAYGHLLRPDILAIPTYGMVNVHASLLPRWRGAAPVHWSILSGDRETGVSIMRVEEGLDTGAVWLMERTPIGATEDCGSLTRRLALMGAEALLEALPRIGNDVTPMSQAEEGATYAPKIDRDTAHLAWSDAAPALAARMRAMDPAPGAWSTLEGREVKCFQPAVAPAAELPPAAPGEILAVQPALVVATGSEPLVIGEVQPAGKRRMSAAEWARGGGVRVGEIFR